MNTYQISKVENGFIIVTSEPSARFAGGTHIFPTIEQVSAFIQADLIKMHGLNKEQVPRPKP